MELNQVQKTFRTRSVQNQLKSFTIPIVIIILFLVSQTTNALKFEDVTEKYGLPTELMKKYGGACITDLDSDNLPDIVLFHHDDCCATAHFNNGPEKKFTSARFLVHDDFHGLSPFVPSTKFKSQKFIAVSVGGSNGNIPRKPSVVTVTKDRIISLKRNKFEDEMFPNSVAGRGRSVLFTRLRRNTNRLGAIVLNFGREGYYHKGLEWRTSKFDLIKSPLGELTNGGTYGALTDIDNDGVMEVLLYQELRMFNLTSDFHYKDISRKVRIPFDFLLSTPTNNRELKGVSAISEIDFNNDGKWDLYATRSSVGDLKWILLYSKEFSTIEDVLLINENGKQYKTVKMPKILSGSNRGVTSGDFNNDGYIDLYVSSETTQYDFLLLNNEGKSFTIQKFKRYSKGPGDMATAFDFDNDGYLDLLVSSGAWHDTTQRGSFYLLKNSGIGVYDNYLNVRVLDSPSGKATNFLAVVKVKLSGRNGFMMRRVGGSNGAGSAVSLINNVHFGMGDWKFAAWVVVEWSNGENQRFSNVTSRRTITAGI